MLSVVMLGYEEAQLQKNTIWLDSTVIFQARTKQPGCRANAMTFAFYAILPYDRLTSYIGSFSS